MFSFFKILREIHGRLENLIEKINGIDNRIKEKTDKNEAELNYIRFKLDLLERNVFNGEILLLRELLTYCNSEKISEHVFPTCLEEIIFFSKEKDRLQFSNKLVGYEKLEGTPCFKAGHAHYYFESLCSKLDLDRELVITFINEKVYFPYTIEYVRLGLLVKTFRFWTLKEKENYIHANLELIQLLQKKYPLSFFSYGTALAAVRDGVFIPHDFDIDISVVLQREVTTNVFQANEDVAHYLTAHGYKPEIEPGGGNMHLIGPNNTFFDIWVGVQNGDWVNWNPGPRDEVRLDMIAPIRNDVKLEGIQIPLPSKCEDYLRIMYGDDWQVPLKAWKRLDSYVFETKT